MEPNSSGEKQPKFRPVESIAKKAIIAIWVNVCVLVLVTPFSIYFLSVDQSSLKDDDLRTGLLALGALVGIGFQVISFIVAGIMFMIWEYRAYLNALIFENPDVDEQAMKSAGVDVVGGWLIPLYNLFKPYQVMTVLWEASTPKPRTDDVFDKRDPKVPVGMKVWWAAWIIGILIDRADQVMKGSGTGPVGSVVSVVTHVIAGVLVVRLIKAITERETHKIHAMQRKDI